MPVAFATTPDQTATTIKDLAGAMITFEVTDPVWVRSGAALMANSAVSQLLWITTDENNVEKSRSLTTNSVAGFGFAPWTEEYIDVPGIYTRKVRFSHNTGTGTVTVYTTLQGNRGASIRTVPA